MIKAYQYSGTDDGRGLFIIGEVKGGEALYLLNAAYTGQICAATVHAPSADRAPEKIVDYAMYDSRYSRNELMK